MTAPDIEALAEVLAAHEARYHGTRHQSRTTCTGCDWERRGDASIAHRTHLATVLAAYVTAKQAEALREAAEEFAAGAWNDAFAAGHVEDDISAVKATEAWFCTWADGIEKGQGRA